MKASESVVREQGQGRHDLLAVRVGRSSGQLHVRETERYEEGDDRAKGQ